MAFTSLIADTRIEQAAWGPRLFEAVLSRRISEIGWLGALAISRSLTFKPHFSLFLIHNLIRNCISTTSAQLQTSSLLFCGHLGNSPGALWDRGKSS